LPWLREFDVLICDEETGRLRICWDFLPQQWTTVSEHYNKDLWHTSAAYGKNDDVRAEANRVYEGIDKVLEKHGYIREGNIYRAVNPNRDTIALFCHFGVECVILSRLLGISPVILWHSFAALPSSVTTLVTEERRKGIASFRMISFGDTAHLYIAGEKPSFVARFCETYDNFDERHD
jgi:probable phosphoglycerate mutase